MSEKKPPGFGETLPLGSTASSVQTEPVVAASSAPPTPPQDDAARISLSAGPSVGQSAGDIYQSHAPGVPGQVATPVKAQTPAPALPDDLLATTVDQGIGATNIQFQSSSGTFAQFRQKAFRTTVLPRLADIDGEAPRLLVEERVRYEKAKQLGEGAMGEVELVFDRDINRFVAVKKLKQELHTPQPLLRFAEEVRVVGQLEHPNIIPIHDVGLDANGQYYFVMKYVEGETLEDVIKRLDAGDPKTHEKYTFHNRARIFYDILKAIQFAHSKGIIHRDIKPANIMLGAHGEVLVMDWGIAKQLPKERRTASRTTPQAADASMLEELQQDPAFQDEYARYQTQNSTLMGTPAYMAPEQAAGANQSLDERSDIYSLCVLFYELMSLKHYMSHKKSIHDLLFGIIGEPPKPAFGLRHPHQGIVPIEYSHFITKGLQKAPNERFQSIEEMLHEMEQLRAGYIKIQCPTTFTKRLVFSLLHTVDRFPWLSFAAIVALFALVANVLANQLFKLIGL